MYTHLQSEPGLLTKCFTCGFEGPHGFKDYVAGIIHYYHGGYNHGDKSCGFFEYGGKPYKTLAEAWRVARKDPRWGGESCDAETRLWAAAWDALILEGKERKHKKLLKAWMELA